MILTLIASLNLISIVICFVLYNRLQKNLKKTVETQHELDKQKSKLSTMDYLHDFQNDAQEKFTLIYQNIFENLSHKLIKNLSESSNKLELSAVDQLQQKIDGEFEIAKIEIVQYQTLQKQKIDQSLETILHFVVEKVLTNGITVNDQEKLIIDALEKANLNP